ncbi:MAG: hypothetical protein ABI895_38835 [Deltaproteobacteria bacterium]
MTTSTLQASGDTYLRSGAPNQNAGGDTTLSLQSVGRRRALLFFDPPRITAAVGSRTLMAARIELTLASSPSNWGLSGRSIAIHRLKQASAEYQATWNCAQDANINNLQDDLQGPTAGSMNSTVAAQPWLSPASATRLITNGRRSTARHALARTTPVPATAVVPSGQECHGNCRAKGEHCLAGGICSTETASGVNRWRAALRFGGV